MAENGREKLLHMHQTTDLAGTDFASVKDLARRLTALSGALLGDSVVRATMCCCLFCGMDRDSHLVHFLFISSDDHLDSHIDEQKRATGQSVGVI